jgi:hypothetical protein
MGRGHVDAGGVGAAAVAEQAVEPHIAQDYDAFDAGATTIPFSGGSGCMPCAQSQTPQQFSNAVLMQNIFERY